MSHLPRGRLVSIGLFVLLDVPLRRGAAAGGPPSPAGGPPSAGSWSIIRSMPCAGGLARRGATSAAGTARTSRCVGSAVRRLLRPLKDPEEGTELAKIVGLELISSLKQQIGDLDRVKRIVKVNGCARSASNGQARTHDLSYPPRRSHCCSRSQRHESANTAGRKSG